MIYANFSLRITVENKGDWMKRNKTYLIAILAIFAFLFTACSNEVYEQAYSVSYKFTEDSILLDSVKLPENKSVTENSDLSEEIRSILKNIAAPYDYTVKVNGTVIDPNSKVLVNSNTVVEIRIFSTISVYDKDSKPTENWYSDDKSTLEINSVNDLMAFVKTSNTGVTFAGKTVLLNIDLDLSGMVWEPIAFGSRKAPEKNVFSGTFDGQNHIIYNLSSNGFSVDKIENATRKDYSYGLFSTVKNATLKNLVLENVNIDLIGKGSDTYKADAVGALVGFVQQENSTDSILTIDNITIRGNGKITSADSASALIGRSYSKGNVSISNVSVGSGISVTGNNKAGSIIAIASNQNELKISHIKNNANINSATIEESGACGGIIGYTNANKNITLEDVVNYGKVSSINTSDGGIIGYCSGGDIEMTMTASKLENYGDVYSEKIHSGGLIGFIGAQNNISISDSIVNANISAPNNSAAGVVGSNQGSLNLNNVSFKGKVDAKDVAAGLISIIGPAKDHPKEVTTISNCKIDESSIFNTTNENVTENNGTVSEGIIRSSAIGQVRETTVNISNMKDTGDYELIGNVYSNGNTTLHLANVETRNPMDWVSNSSTVKLLLESSTIQELVWKKCTLNVGGIENKPSTIVNIKGSAGAVVNKYNFLTITKSSDVTLNDKSSETLE